MTKLINQVENRDEESSRKLVRINEVPEDLEHRHAMRLGRKLHRMKRKLLLDAVAQDSRSSSSSILGGSTSSLPRFDDDDDEDDNGEAMFQRGRRVPYHSGSSSVVFDSNSSLATDLSEGDFKDIHEAIEQRRGRYTQVSRGPDSF